jgi:hypothetical protein
MSSVPGTLLDSFLWVESDTLDPDRLTTAFGLEPVVSERPGQVGIDVDGSALDPSPGQWIARTAGHLRSASVDEHLHFLLARLAPHRSLVRELAASSNGRVWLGLEIAPDAGRSLGSVLDAVLARAIRELGADVWEVGPGEIPGGSDPLSN